MSEEREFDIVVFGASGFTGKYVTEELFKVNKTEQLKWAIAGRSVKKMEQVLADIRKDSRFSSGELSLEIIVADIDDYQSLLMMCQRARVILDCVGPYRFFGEPVVKACVESKTNYIDICGEPQFLENMQLKYHEGAKLAGIHVVGACGFDSIPSDMGVMFAKQQFDGILNSITCYLELKSGPHGFGLHYGTYASAVHGVSDVGSLAKIRKGFKYNPLPKVGPKLQLKAGVHYESSLGAYAIPFLGADRSIVIRTQRYLHEEINDPPIQYSMYSCISGLWNIFLFMIFGGIFKFLATKSWGKNLLLKHPRFFTCGIFSHEGPTEEQLKETSFSLTMYGEGYSNGKNNELNRTDKMDQKIKIKVSGPEAGYVATPILMVQAAVVMIKETGKLPEKGGVLTPGAVFHRTSLIERLRQKGIEFDVLK